MAKKIAKLSEDKVFGKHHYQARQMSKSVGYFPNLVNPQSLNEIIAHRMLYLNGSKEALLTDKVLMRDFIKKSGFESFLVPKIGVFDSCAELNWENLPSQFVIKANNGSGTNLIVWDKKEHHKSEVQKLFKSYKDVADAFFFSNEHHYFKIKPRILVGELMLTNSGSIPNDIKFHCSQGDVLFVQIDKSRFQNHTRDLYSSAGILLKAQLHYPNSSVKESDISQNAWFSIAKNIAKTLSKNLDFVRVDFYNFEESELKLGELTFTPGGGCEKFDPVSWDFTFGKALASRLPNDKLTQKSTQEREMSAPPSVMSSIKRFLFHTIKATIANYGYVIRKEDSVFLLNPNSHIKSDPLDYFLSQLARDWNNFTFLQIGGNDGKSGDFIFPFVSKFNLAGIIVEPQTNAFDRLNQNYIANTNLRFVRAAIGTDLDVEAKYIEIFKVATQSQDIFTEVSDGLATVNYQRFLKLLQMLRPDIEQLEQHIEKEIVPVIHINSLLHQMTSKSISLLLIDTEGYDYEIIKGIDFTTFKPRLIIYEHALLSSTDQLSCTQLLVNQGYDICVIHSPHGDTVARLT
jgi:FkbM family methyltransferase